MATKGNIFTKAGRIFVVAVALSLFADAVTGCGKTEEQEAEDHAAKGNAALNKMRSLLTDLSYDGVIDDDTTKLTEKTAAASDSQLVEWRSKLKSLIAQSAIVKAEKDQKNVIGGPSDFQLEAVATASRDSLTVIESEMRKRNLIK